MQRQWVGKNVDLTLLSMYVEDFFKVRGFKTRKDESAGKYTILWAPPRVSNMRGAMTVTIMGDANDFVVELNASERTSRSIKLGLLTTMFGGGYFLLRGIRLREALEKLEKEFWVYAEEKVANLVGSAERRTTSS